MMNLREIVEQLRDFDCNLPIEGVSTQGTPVSPGRLVDSQAFRDLEEWAKWEPAPDGLVHDDVAPILVLESGTYVEQWRGGEPTLFLPRKLRLWIRRDE